MYKITDRREAIKQVQQFLYAVNKQDTYIAPSGVYDEATKEAVRSFQADNDIEITGTVDIQTFNSLYKEYVRIEKDKEARSILDNDTDFPVIPGDYGEGVRGINKMMTEILDYYGVYHRLTDSRYYSVNTSRGVAALRKIYDLEQADAVDENLFIQMTRDRASMK